MTVEEVFYKLSNIYGDEFGWQMVPPTNSFVFELKRELGQEHFLCGQQIWAIAKCERNDDVLYVAGTDDGTDIYYIFHLTYSEHNAAGFPKSKKFLGIEALREYLEQTTRVDTI